MKPSTSTDPDGFTTYISRKRNTSASSLTSNKDDSSHTPKKARNPDPYLPNPRSHKAAIPSIILDSCIESHSFLKQFKQTYSPVYFETTLRNNKLLVYIETATAHRNLQTFAERSKMKFTTVQLEEDRPLKVVLRNIPSFISPEEVQDALVDLKYQVESVVQMTSAATKDKLPMFIATLKRENNYEDIFNLKTLCYSRIRVERFQQRRVIQCYNCQEFNHGSRVCKRNPACLHCAEQHDTRHCINKDTVKPKCANCKGDHKSIDKLCPTRIRAEQGLRYRLQQSINITNHIQTKSYANILPDTPKQNHQHIRSTSTYASPARRRLNLNQSSATPTNNTSIHSITKSKPSATPRSQKVSSNIAREALNMAIERIKSLKPMLLEETLITNLILLSTRASSVEPLQQEELIAKFVKDTLKD